MTKRIISIILVVAALFSLCITASATETSYLVDYAGEYVYYATYGYGDMFYLMASPDENGFINALEAANVTWTPHADNISGVYILNTYPLMVDDTHYVSVAEVAVSGNSPLGAASIRATAENGAYVDFTIVNHYSNGTGSSSGITCKFYTVADDATETLLTTVTGLDPAWNTHYGDTNYVSAIDAVVAAYLNSAAITGLSVNHSAFTPVYYVSSMTISGNPYAEDYDGDYIGWQYRVYRNGSLIELSDPVGADQFYLHQFDSGNDNNYTIVWKYGKNGVVSFNTTLS